MLRSSTSLIARWRSAAGAARTRLRGRMLAILQTAAAAVAAWYVAAALLPDPRPSFASIAAVIAVGASHGQRTGRALQLVGGVVLGLTVADLIVHLIGTGPWQIGVLVVLAMATAVALGGGELLVVEAGVSAILLVALAVTSLLFPPDPALGPGRAAQAVFVQLGRTLERLAGALEAGDARAAEQALRDARAIDRLMHSVQEQLEAGRETARFSPPRRAARDELDRYERSLEQIDFAIRNARVLARHVLSLLRGGGAIPAELPSAVRRLSHAVWELAASYDAPSHVEAARRLAVHAAGEAGELRDARPELVMVGGQVRSVAVDLVRAGDLVASESEAPAELPTQELLLRGAAA